MTAPPKRSRGRPLTTLGGSPFAAPPFDEERRKRWVDLVDALAEVQLRRPVNGRHLLGEALAERMFPTGDWGRYTVSHEPPGEGAVIRNADGRGHEAVERWLLHRNLLWLQAIDAAQRRGAVERWRRAHARLADRLVAFEDAPHDPATARAAAEALDKLTPGPLPAARAALATPRGAAALAEGCRGVAADVKSWLEDHDTSRGRAAFAHAVAAVVADLFDAAGAGQHVRFARQGQGQSDPARGPANAYCKAVAGALEALGAPPGRWRYAAEAVCADRAGIASEGSP